MAETQVQRTTDSVCKVAQNGDLAKTLNTLRTVPGAKNPFVSSRQGESSGGSGNSNTSSGAQTNRK
jgi:hypothetical protein